MPKLNRDEPKHPKMWRCLMCKVDVRSDGNLKPLDFESDVPVCPSCSADMRNPQHRNIITPIELTHFLIEDEKGPIIGNGCMFYIACRPDQKHGEKLMTGESRAVTCPNCKKHPDWQPMDEDNLFQGRIPQVVDKAELMEKLELNKKKATSGGCC